MHALGCQLSALSSCQPSLLQKSIGTMRAGRPALPPRNLGRHQWSAGLLPRNDRPLVSLFLKETELAAISSRPPSAAAETSPEG